MMTDRAGGTGGLLVHLTCASAAAHTCGHVCEAHSDGGLSDAAGTPPGNVPASCIMDYVKASQFPVRWHATTRIHHHQAA